MAQISHMSLFAVCCVSAGALRKGPAHEAEMISQLLFGETATVLEIAGSEWARVQCRFDGYEGWCLQSHITTIEQSIYEEPSTALTAGWVNEVKLNGQVVHVPFGCPLPDFKAAVVEWQGNQLAYTGALWKLNSAVADEAALREVAFRYLNTAYLWGGKSVFGIDCSGFTQAVYRFFNVVLPRDAWQQAELGQPVDFLQQARCGDLAFFDNADGRIIHVGMLLGASEIIHAAGKVRVDKIDNAGIINADSGKRTHTLRIIKSIF